MSECPRCRIKRLGLNHHTAHAPGCPNSIPPEKRNQKPCGICGEIYSSSGLFPKYCKPCFDQWVEVGI